VPASSNLPFIVFFGRREEFSLPRPPGSYHMSCVGVEGPEEVAYDLHAYKMHTYEMYTFKKEGERPFYVLCLNLV